MAKILIVEDEKHLADGLAFNLRDEGYEVEIAPDGETALKAMRSSNNNSFDALVLDVMLPGKDGFEVARELRKAGKFVPILMLTARGRPEDVLQGFEAGADDYLPKPFELSILLARLRGLLRRHQWIHMATAADNGQAKDRAAKTNDLEDSFTFSSKTVDFSLLELRVGKKTYRLTLMEMELLRYLIQSAGRPVSRKAILEDVWDLHEDTDTRAIDNFIARLRKYIERFPAKPQHLLTVRGVGYKFVAEPEAKISK